MAGFFDKLKQGAQEASKKAQITVEVNRLKLQISSINKEITRLYTLIGEAVHAQISQGSAELPAECLEWSKNIIEKKQEIEQIESKIRELRDEYVCASCGHVNSREDKFCSECGAKIEIQEVAPAQLESWEAVYETEATCPSCGKLVTPGKKFCGHCGHTLVTDDNE